MQRVICMPGLQLGLVFYKYMLYVVGEAFGLLPLLSFYRTYDIYRRFGSVMVFAFSDDFASRR